jgi:hypothetical protein
MSATRNQRLAWIAKQLSEGKSNSAIVLDCMTAFKGVSETVARRDLKEILQRLTEIEIEGLPEIKTRMMEVGWKLLEDARSLGQMGAAVNQFKTLAILSGALNEHEKENKQQTGTPESQVIRERIAQLMKSKKIQAQAQDAGIDLKELKD